MTQAHPQRCMVHGVYRAPRRRAVVDGWVMISVGPAHVRAVDSWRTSGRPSGRPQPGHICGANGGIRPRGTRGEGHPGPPGVHTCAVSRVCAMQPTASRCVHPKSGEFSRMSPRSGRARQGGIAHPPLLPPAPPHRSACSMRPVCCLALVPAEYTISDTSFEAPAFIITCHLVARC